MLGIFAESVTQIDVSTSCFSTKTELKAAISSVLVFSHVVVNQIWFSKAFNDLQDHTNKQKSDNTLFSKQPDSQQTHLPNSSVCPEG